MWDREQEQRKNRMCTCTGVLFCFFVFYQITETNILANVLALFCLPDFKPQDREKFKPLSHIIWTLIMVHNILRVNKLDIKRNLISQSTQQFLFLFCFFLRKFGPTLKLYWTVCLMLLLVCSAFWGCSFVWENRDTPTNWWQKEGLWNFSKLSLMGLDTKRLICASVAMSLFKVYLRKVLLGLFT